MVSDHARAAVSRTRLTAGALVAAVVLGVVVAVAGTLVHRWDAAGWPAGLLLALATAALAAVAARAGAGGAGVVLYGLAALVTSQVMAFVSPGGDVLVTDEAIGYGWLLGLPLSTVVAALTPGRWYSGEPAPLPAAAVRGPHG